MKVTTKIADAFRKAYYNNTGDETDDPVMIGLEAAFQAAHPHGKLLYRPFEFDDWGMIRHEDGKMFASVRRPLSTEEAAAHRTAKTDPFEEIALRLISAYAADEGGT